MLNHAKIIPMYALSYTNLMRFVILFHVKNAIESLRPLARLAVIAQDDAIENHISPIFLSAQIAKAILHPKLPQLELHRC